MLILLDQGHLKILMGTTDFEALRWIEGRKTRLVRSCPSVALIAYDLVDLLERFDPLTPGML
jgi:hypothetical protein